MSMAEPYGKVVTVQSHDTVRIETSGCGAVSVPAKAFLAYYQVLRYLVLEDDNLTLEEVEDAYTGKTGWQASLGVDAEIVSETHNNPWAAMIDLAERIQVTEEAKDNP